MNTCCMYTILAARIKHNKNGSQIRSYIFNSSVATSVRRRTGDQKQLSNFKWFEKYLKLIKIASDKDQMVQHSTQLNKKTVLGWDRNGDVKVYFLKIRLPRIFICRECFNTYPKYEQYLSLLSPVTRIVPYMPHVSHLSVNKTIIKIFHFFQNDVWSTTLFKTLCKGSAFK